MQHNIILKNANILSIFHTITYKFSHLTLYEDLKVSNNIITWAFG